MIIAVAADGEKVSLHFGKCTEYRLFHIEKSEIARQETLDNPGHSPGALPEFLKRHGVDCIIAGGMGPRAEKLFTEYGIKVVTGALGPVEDIIGSYLSGSLITGDSSCDHITS